MIRRHWLLIVVILLAAWIFHVHYNRGIPVKRNAGK